MGTGMPPRRRFAGWLAKQAPDNFREEIAGRVGLDSVNLRWEAGLWAIEVSRRGKRRRHMLCTTGSGSGLIARSALHRGDEASSVLN